MCGIVGALIFDDSSARIDAAYVEKLRDTMVHRGPDGGGTWIGFNGRIGFGHRRLSIIDLSTTANQPMESNDGTVCLVFNGEIYNHAEIRRELQALGHTQWKTDHSDTEVVVKAYQEWGLDCVHRFRGMFAIALWDDKKKELFLLRDRIGVKPLYYTIQNGRLIFASEIKAIIADPQVKRGVSEEAFFHYLTFLTTPAPQTLFEGIKKLPAATCLRVKPSGQVTEMRYWDVWDYTKPLINVSEEEVAARLIDELRTAVKLRKVSDVPVGVFLSGGIDSSTNAALFSEGESSRVKTFTIGYEGTYQTYQNELHYARQMADLVKAEHHEKLLTVDDLMSFLPQMIHLQDEPIADPVCVPVYYVSKLARDNGVIVCQVGEGSDELFWGYESWKEYLNLQRANDWPIPNAFKKFGLAALRAAGRDQSFEYELLRRGASDTPVFWSGAIAFTEAQKIRLLSPRLRQKFKGYTSWEAIKPIHQRFMDKAWDHSALSWMSYIDLNLRLPELLLMRVDKMSMGVSLEGRVPFLDYKFVELAMSIPPEMKTRNGTLKHILKKAVRGVIPDELIDRKKQGFGVPVYEWLFDKLGKETEKVLTSFAEETDFFDPQTIRNYLSANQGHQLWYLLNFALWWRHFIKA
jgi:asparagine synthase (glutamine-hydrolysing)